LCLYVVSLSPQSHPTAAYPQPAKLPISTPSNMTSELVQTLAEHGISSTNGAMTTDEALVYRLLDSVAADGGLTADAKKEVRMK